MSMSDDVTSIYRMRKMAASMKLCRGQNQTYSRIRHLVSYAVLQRSSHSGSSANSVEENSRLPRVGMSSDGRTLIAWHPEPQHPYEHTQPLQYDLTEAKEGSVLKDQLIRNYETRYRMSGPNMQELANITFTTKHPWYPKPEKKYKKRNPPKDRDSI